VECADRVTWLLYAQRLHPQPEWRAMLPLAEHELRSFLAFFGCDSAAQLQELALCLRHGGSVWTEDVPRLLRGASHLLLRYTHVCAPLQSIAATAAARSCSDGEGHSASDSASGAAMDWSAVPSTAPVCSASASTASGRRAAAPVRGNDYCDCNGRSDGGVLMDLSM
jgi:hypothetical protein